MDLTPEDLPAPHASLAELIRFANAHDPTLTFRARWGTDYGPLAMDLWNSLLEAFHDGRPAQEEFSREEMLMGLHYDIAAGPHARVAGEAEALAFHRWVLMGLRRSFI